MPNNRINGIQAAWDRLAGRNNGEAPAEPQVVQAGAGWADIFNDQPIVPAQPAWRPVPMEWRPAPMEKARNGKEGEELFHLILSGIREIYDVDATIAGGAVRDLAFKIDHVVKDVDVFIPLTWEKFEPNVDELGWQQTPFLLKKGGYENCVVPSTARGQGQVQYKLVDLVFMDKPLTPENVASFPIFAQRCVWTLNEGLAISPEAKQDLENKTFTIDPTITNKEKLKKIVAKAQEWCKRPGYEGWKVVEPDIAEWWEAKKEVVERKYLTANPFDWSPQELAMYAEKKLAFDVEKGRYYIA
jgi:hypothetical protein